MATEQLDYFKLIKEAKQVDRSRCHRSVRVAFVADCSTQHLTPLIKALLFQHGIFCEVYEAQYDAIAQEAYAADSALYAFRPDVIMVFNSVSALRQSYCAFEGPVSDFTARALQRIRGIWDILKRQSSAIILQSNFAVPYDRIFGNYELKANASFHAAVVSLNGLIANAAQDGASVLINDIDYISSYLGRQRWFDEKLWLLCKAPCALDCLPYVAQSVATTIMALLGLRTIKCIILDLDNTLWGGVIGDDGLEGILLGEFGDGQAYQSFQHYLLALKRRGILLAVCSRNDADTALLPFRRHPDMVLKENDLAAFVANYQNKADNLKAIQRQLNIGFDSMLFIDDDPFERNLIRAELPEVLVPEMPADPANFVKALCERGLFEAVSFSEEDRQRTRIYHEETQRNALQASFSNIDDYLRSLEMGAVLQRFDPFHLPRIAQLLARSNQFNLMTHRYSLAECEQFMNDQAGCSPFYITLKDTLGDSGLICAVILLRKKDDLEIAEWVMSCRVLLRGVEQLTMNAIFESARSGGAKRVIGRYRPTPKNGLVKDIFAKFSFERISETTDGTTTWGLDVGRYADKPTFIQVRTEVH